MTISKELWGVSPCGKEVYLYTLKNEKGAYVQVSNIGAAIISIVVPDKDGNLAFVIGKASFEVDQLVDNYFAAQDEVLRLKPASAKGRYVMKGSVSTTMGPGIPLDTSKTRISE